MTITTRACLLAASLLCAPLAVASGSLPAQGMSMDEVRAAFGSHAYDLGTVGTPAITRWVYDGYTVYFEGRRVLHVVRTQPLPHGGSVARPAPAAPVPVAPVRPAAAPAPASALPATTPGPATMPEPTPVFVTPAPAIAPVAAEAESLPESPAAGMTPAAPVPGPAAVAEPAPQSEPAPMAEPAPAPAKASASGFYFDPVTGRLVLDGEEPAPAAVPADASGDSAGMAPMDDTAEPEAVAPEPAAPSEPAPATPAPTPAPGKAPAPAKAAKPAAEDAGNGNLGTALDETLEFDPDTGTFRSIH